MAVQLVEAFDWCDVGMTGTQISTALSRKCPALNAAGEMLAGLGGKGSALAFTGGISQFCRWDLAAVPIAVTSEVGMGIWFKCIKNNQLPWTNANRTFMGTVNSFGNAYHLNIQLASTGELLVSAGSTVLERTGFFIEPEQWYWIDFKTIVNATTGSYTARVDGVTIGSGTNVNTTGGSGGTSFVQTQGVLSASGTKSVTDAILCWDDQGGTLTDFPTLPISFVSIHPDGDGDDEQWSTSSGTDSYALVDETAPHDDDSNYLQDSTTGNRSLFTYDNVSTNFTGIHGIQINSVLRETDATNFTFINTFKQNSTLYPESAQAVAGQSYESLFNVLDQDPDTSSAWTVTGVNSVQAGIEVG